MITFIYSHFFFIYSVFVSIIFYPISHHFGWIRTLISVILTEYKNSIQGKISCCERYTYQVCICLMCQWRRLTCWLSILLLYFIYCGGEEVVGIELNVSDFTQLLTRVRVPHYWTFPCTLCQAGGQWHLVISSVYLNKNNAS